MQECTCTLVARPSTVVMSPPSDPVVMCRSSSGMDTSAVSDLITSRLRSAGSRTCASSPNSQ